MREFPHMLFHWEFDLSMAFGLLAPISCLEMCSPFLDCCSKIKKILLLLFAHLGYILRCNNDGNVSMYTILFNA